MKSKIFFVYVAMTIVGLIGILVMLISQPSQHSQPHARAVLDNIAEPTQETITVAVALKDIKANSVLSEEDFRLKSVDIAQGSNEKQQYSVGNKTLISSVIDKSISAGAVIPTTSIIEPDTPAYLTKSLKPGNILYTFSLTPNDNYLLDNLKPGQNIDIYLAYSKETENDGSEFIISPSKSIENTRLKPILKDRRVLALRPAKEVDRNGVSIIESGSQVIVELKDNDIKILKGLEDKAKLFIFPASKDRQPTGEESILTDVESMWPVSEDIILNKESKKTEMNDKVNEIRG